MTPMTTTHSPAVLLDRLKAKLRCPTWTSLSWKLEVSEAQISKWRKPNGKMSRLTRNKLEALLRSKP